MAIAAMGVGVALIGAISTAAQQPPPAGEFSELEALARTELKSINAPGAAIAIVKGDRIVYRQGIGLANVETGQTMTPDMLFR